MLYDDREWAWKNTITLDNSRVQKNIYNYRKILLKWRLSLAFTAPYSVSFVLSSLIFSLLEVQLSLPLGLSRKLIGIWTHKVNYTILEIFPILWWKINARIYKKCFKRAIENYDIFLSREDVMVWHDILKNFLLNIFFTIYQIPHLFESNNIWAKNWSLRNEFLLKMHHFKKKGQGTDIIFIIVHGLLKVLKLRISCKFRSSLLLSKIHIR